ncbi:MAG: hypothetical protein WCH98_07430 [Verrucomicrobiota bacterium]
MADNEDFWDVEGRGRRMVDGGWWMPNRISLLALATRRLTLDPLRASLISQLEECEVHGIGDNPGFPGQVSDVPLRVVCDTDDAVEPGNRKRFEDFLHFPIRPRLHRSDLIDQPQVAMNGQDFRVWCQGRTDRTPALGPLGMHDIRLDFTKLLSDCQNRPGMKHPQKTPGGEDDLMVEDIRRELRGSGNRVLSAANDVNFDRLKVGILDFGFKILNFAIIILHFMALVHASETLEQGGRGRSEEGLRLGTVETIVNDKKSNAHGIY